jgi:ribonuclease-3
LENQKGELQELLQADSAEPPEYRLERTTGPDHDRLFECAVFHRGVELGRGRGKSKKAAESEAALGALERLRAGGKPVPVAAQPVAGQTRPSPGG